jgi:sec-independent protein translocase protein TatC
MLPIVAFSTFFFIAGALFGYLLVFPIGFKFFLSFATDTIRPMPSMKEYLSFSISFLLAFGIVFELPILLTFLARIGVVSAGFLSKNRKYAILLIFIVAAILTPPDVVSQTLMALPLMFLYEIGIIGARIFGKKKMAEEAAEAASPPEETPEGSH